MPCKCLGLLSDVWKLLSNFFHMWAVRSGWIFHRLASGFIHSRPWFSFNTPLFQYVLALLHSPRPCTFVSGGQRRMPSGQWKISWKPFLRVASNNLTRRGNNCGPQNVPWNPYSLLCFSLTHAQNVSITLQEYVGGDGRRESLHWGYKISTQFTKTWCMNALLGPYTEPWRKAFIHLSISPLLLLLSLWKWSRDSSSLGSVFSFCAGDACCRDRPSVAPSVLGQLSV